MTRHGNWSIILTLEGIEGRMSKLIKSVKDYSYTHTHTHRERERERERKREILINCFTTNKNESLFN